MLTTDRKRIEMMSDAEIKRRIGDALDHMPESPAAEADFRSLFAEREHRAHERDAATAHQRPAPARPNAPDFSDVRGQSLSILDHVKAAVRSHLDGAPTVLLLNGAPGTGKTMIARRVTGVLPAPTEHERAWIAAEYEGAGTPLGRYIGQRPFRAPHHTISEVALVGQPTSLMYTSPSPTCRCKREINGSCFHHTPPRGPVGRVGELGLARFGVLFLDELIEFRLAALESLGRAWLAMAGRPLIVAAVTPCPCGWADSGVSGRDCTCSPEARTRYAERIGKALAAIVGGKLAEYIFAVDVASQSLNDLRHGHGTPWPSSVTIAKEITNSIVV